MASETEQPDGGDHAVGPSGVKVPLPPGQLSPPFQPSAASLPATEALRTPSLDKELADGELTDNESAGKGIAAEDTAESTFRFLPVYVERLLARRGTAPFLISIITHTMLLLLLALLTLTISRHDSDRFSFSASHKAQRQTSEPLVVLPGASSSAAPQAQQVVAEQPTSSDPSEISNSIDQLLTQSNNTTGKTPGELAFSTQSAAIETVRTAASYTSQADFTHMGVEGRDLQRRRQIALANGGTIRSEQAVENALRWLAEHQMASGAWSVVHDTHKCKGRCKNNGSPERFDTAATGLALLAFLGAGYTHQDGQYQDTVQRGLYFLMRSMEDTQGGGSWMYTSDKGMYNHGIAAFAVCEAYQMTGDPDLRRAAQRGADFIAYAQNYVGGWGYLPGKPGDLTISGWQVMALKSAQAAKLSLPGNLTFRLDKFLKTQQVEGEPFYGYRKPDKQATCTAIGNLIRLLRGRSPTDPDSLKAAEYLLAQGVDRTDVYFNYYVSLYLFHIGGPTWESFNAPVREYLISTQATGGHEAGSWYFDNQYGKVGGRLYTTAMAAMTLEVYYRYQPLYQQVGTAFEL